MGEARLRGLSGIGQYVLMRGSVSLAQMREKLVKERLQDMRENVSRKLKEYHIHGAFPCVDS